MAPDTPIAYLPIIIMFIIAVAFAGVAVAIYARIDDWKRGRR